jgi:hypothetical protein
MIRSSFAAADELSINESDIILLAGGDVERGWKVFQEVGLTELIIKRYYQGALLIGISAGAVQLGMCALAETKAAPHRLIETFKIVPFVIGAHEEREEWKSLRETLRLLEGSAKGLGIPAGGGLVYHPERGVEAIRYPVYEFSPGVGATRHSVLIPHLER